MRHAELRGVGIGRKRGEKMDDEWPEILYEVSDWPDDILANTVSERTKVPDDVLQIVRFLLSEGREMDW